MSPLSVAKGETVTQSVFKMRDEVKPQISNQNYKTSLEFKVQNLDCGGGLNWVRRHSQWDF